MGALTPLGSPRLAPAPSGPRASLPPPQDPEARSCPLRPARLAPAFSGPRASLPPPQAPARRRREPARPDPGGQPQRRLRARRASRGAGRGEAGTLVRW